MKKFLSLFLTMAAITCHADNDITLKAIGGMSKGVAVPTTFGIPFAKGELKKTQQVEITSADGKVLPTDQWTLASWPDGSVKWKAVATVTDSPTLTGKVVGMVKKGEKDASATTAKHEPMFWLEKNGMRQDVTKQTVEQDGNVRSCIRYEGENHIIRQYTYKESGIRKLVITTFIDSMTAKNGLHDLSLKVSIPMNGKDYDRKVSFLMDDTTAFSMDVQPLIARRQIRLNDQGEPADALSKNMIRQIASWDGFRLSQLSPNGFSIRKRATAQSPWIGTIEGHRAPGMIAIGNNTSSVALHLTDFWQTYPSTLQVDDMRSDMATVTLSLWSKEAEAMRFEHYDTIPHGLDAAYEDVQPGMSTANGIAVTSTIYLYSYDKPIDELTAQLPSLAQHPQFVCTPEYLHEKKAFGIWSLDKGTKLDTLLYNIKDFYAEQQEKHGWYGLFNYGDFMHSYDKERGEWRYDVGGYAWDNTELGTPAMLWYEFLRTGDATAYRLATAMTRHCSEVDTYHRGPNAGLGTRHNVLHWGCGAKEARVSEAFWNRFMYYLTADERLGDIMHEVVDADQLLYTLDPMRLAQPRSDRYPCTAPARLRVGPDWVGYVSNWFTEWERFGETKYRDKILAGMKSISAMPHGIFSGPKALGYDPATGIISWEGSKDVQNTNHLLAIMGGFEMMNEVMLSLNTKQWEKTWLDFCANYKENALTISRNNFRVPRLKGYAYWKTGKKDYIEDAMKDLMKGNPFYNTNNAATFTLDAIFLQEVNK